MRIFSERSPEPIRERRWDAVGFLLVAEFLFVEFGAEDLQGEFLVLDLRAAVFAADVEAGGKVENLDRGLGAVDVLAAGAAGAADLDAQVVGFELDIDFLGFRQHGHGDGGGVDAALGFGGGHALDAVDAGFVFQEAEHLVAGDFQDDFLEAADFRRAAVEVLAFPAADVGVALVQRAAVRRQTARPRRRRRRRGFRSSASRSSFGSAGSRAYWRSSAELRDCGLKPGDFLGGHGGELGIVGFGEFLVVGELAFGGLEFFPEVEGLLELAGARAGSRWRASDRKTDRDRPPLPPVRRSVRGVWR